MLVRFSWEGQMYACKVFVGRTDGKIPLGRLDVGGRIILRWILEE
jgi:hypothetical protein